MGNLLHVLIAEDSEDDTFLLIRQLKQGGYDPTYERVETSRGLVESLDRQPWDIVISDYAMPQFGGLDALRIVKERRPDLPFILVSGTIGEDTAVTAMRAGAQDYIMKSNLTRLVPAVERELREAQVRRARQQAEVELHRSDERFRLTIEGVHDYAIFMLDPDGRIINWNEGAERVFGYKVPEIIGQHFARFYLRQDQDSNKPLDDLRSAAAEGRFGDEGWRCRKDGTQFWADSVITTLRDDNGNMRGFVEIARDITERKHAQEEIKRYNLELTHAYDATIEGWSRALDLRDRETEGHTLRVTESAEELARLMDFSTTELVHLHRGALLHDIGKMGIPDRILLKPGWLDAEEWEVMRLHPTYAYEWLSPIAFLAPSLDIPYCHHEKWDGSGYPRGLAGEEIPLAARIFTVVDVWDALTSDRPYRTAWPKSQARRYLREQSNIQFDPRVVETFLDSRIGGNGHG